MYMNKSEQKGMCESIYSLIRVARNQRSSDKIGKLILYSGTGYDQHFKNTVAISGVRYHSLWLSKQLIDPIHNVQSSSIISIQRLPASSS
jgi:hypothetical protein